MYIIVCMRLQLHNREQINKYFPHRSAYLLSPHPINHFFNKFLLDSFGVGLNDLLPTIQYCSTFLTGGVCLGEVPSVEKCTFSSYCSYQTYNEYGLFLLQKRDRGLFWGNFIYLWVIFSTYYISDKNITFLPFFSQAFSPTFIRGDQLRWRDRDMG